MNEPKDVQTVETRFKRSKLCRVIHADGAFGSLTAQLNIHMAIYSEHRAFPEGSTIRIDAQGIATDTLAPDPGIFIREIEADVILSESGAVGLRTWLDQQIKLLQDFRAESTARTQTQTEQR